MAFTSRSDRPGSKIRRTNSLAFAKSDCHTCSTLELSCDRYRPRCARCQEAGRLCQGYSMSLTWQANHTVIDKPPKVKRTTPKLRNGSDENPRVCGTSTRNPCGEKDVQTSPAATRQFMFVENRPAKRRKKIHESTTSRNEERTRSSRGPRLGRNHHSNLPQIVQYAASDAMDACDGELFTLTPEEQCWTSSPVSIGPASPSDPLTYDRLDWTVVAEESPGGEELKQIQRQPFHTPTTTTSVAWEVSSWNDDDRASSEAGYSISTMTTQLGCFLNFIPQVVYPTLHDKFYSLLDMCMWLSAGFHLILTVLRRQRILQIPHHGRFLLEPLSLSTRDNSRLSTPSSRRCGHGMPLSASRSHSSSPASRYH